MAKEHLIKARELIEAGWTKHALVRCIDGKECYCLDGAVLAAHSPKLGVCYAALRYDSPETLIDLEYLVKFIPEKDRPGQEDVITAAYSFNDASSRTKDEVLAVLDRAIMSYPEETTV